MFAQEIVRLKAENAGLTKDFFEALRRLAQYEANRETDQRETQQVIEALRKENEEITNELLDVLEDVENLNSEISSLKELNQELSSANKKLIEERDGLAEKLQDRHQDHVTEADLKERINLAIAEERFRTTLVLADQRRTEESMKKLQIENEQMEKEIVRLSRSKTLGDTDSTSSSKVPAAISGTTRRSRRASLTMVNINTKEWLNTAVDFFVTKDNTTSGSTSPSPSAENPCSNSIRKQESECKRLSFAGPCLLDGNTTSVDSKKIDNSTTSAAEDVTKNTNKVRAIGRRGSLSSTCVVDFPNASTSSRRFGRRASLSSPCLVDFPTDHGRLDISFRNTSFRSLDNKKVSSCKTDEDEIVFGASVSPDCKYEASSNPKLSEQETKIASVEFELSDLINNKNQSCDDSDTSSEQDKCYYSWGQMSTLDTTSNEDPVSLETKQKGLDICEMLSDAARANGISQGKTVRNLDHEKLTTSPAFFKHGSLEKRIGLKFASAVKDICGQTKNTILNEAA